MKNSLRVHVMLFFCTNVAVAMADLTRGNPVSDRRIDKRAFANSVNGDGDDVRASAFDCHVFNLISDQHRKDRLSVAPRLQSSVN